MDKQEKDAKSLSEEQRKVLLAQLAKGRGKATAQYLRARGKAGVTLTRNDLAHLARLLKAGKIMLNDTAPVSPALKGAMTKLGIDTNGL